MSKVKSAAGKGIEISLSWQKASNGHIPNDSVNAGNSYIARAVYNGEYIPGKIVRGENCAYICYDGKEISCSEYEVLVDTHNFGGQAYEWKSSRGSVIPKGSVIGGSDEGRPLYIGRARVADKLLAGKFQPEHGCTYIPYDSQENRKEDYDVLCFLKRRV